MIVGAVCLSHSPLRDKARANPDVEARYDSALKNAAEIAQQLDPDLTVVFFPDHFNGFFYDLMPSFCIGAQATSIGDYGSVPGPLDVPEEFAVDLAQSVLRQGVDVGLSYRMQVDHGAVQPLELLSPTWTAGKIIPIFVNCAAPPRPSFSRTRALGAAVGHWALASDRRVLFLGSGGLSHDPPLPSIAKAAPEVRERMIDGRRPSFAARLARQSKIFGAGTTFVAGTSALRPLNREWDQEFVDRLTAGDLQMGDAWDDDNITAAAGSGGHEVRTWIAAMTALTVNGAYDARLHFYEEIPEWLTGMAVLTAETAGKGE
jgi:2,3-dihydroxyphenylpropionate 1,2-dioxygenase